MLEKLKHQLTEIMQKPESWLRDVQARALCARIESIERQELAKDIKSESLWQKNLKTN